VRYIILIVRMCRHAITPVHFYKYFKFTMAYSRHFLA
jgi:hypothetical protein